MNKLKQILVAALLSVAVIISGCAGKGQPDYALIELGSVAAFTVIVNETKASDKKVVKAYEGLTILENTINSPESILDLYILDNLLSNALPPEYQAMAVTGSKLIRRRVRSYMRTKLPEDMITEHEVTMKVTLAVVQGAKAALKPKYDSIIK